MGEGEDDFGGRRWSEFLLPAVRGANDSGSSGGGCNNNVSAGAHGAVSGEDDDSYNGPATSLVLSSTQPSYMRSKTGVEMDPDRVSLFILSRRPFVVECVQLGCRAWAVMHAAMFLFFAIIAVKELFG